jgi:hypothetical protein
MRGRDCTSRAFYRGVQLGGDLLRFGERVEFPDLVIRFKPGLAGAGDPAAERCAGNCYPAPMDIANILNALRVEHAQLTEAILSIERMAAGQGKRRGRPPAWMAAARQDSAPKRRGRPPGSKNAAKKQN